MNPNPYASPLADDSPPPDGNQVFRDRGDLVLHVDQFRLPAICLITGAPTEETLRIEGRFLAKSIRTWAGLLGGVVGIAFFGQLYGKQLTLRLPVRTDALVTRRRWTGSDAALVATSVVVFIAGMVLSYWHGIFAMIAMLTPIGVAVYFFVTSSASRAPLFVHDVALPWVWIRGAHPDVVKQFPDWPGRR